MLEDFNIGVDWSKAVSEAEPSGKNTEYDTKFAELENAAISTTEQQYGATVIAGKEPDWQQMLRLATDLSLQTRDLRVLLLLTRAMTRIHGLKGLLYGLNSVNTVSRQFWDSLHPQLMVDDEFDPQMRFNALSNFGDIEGLAADTRQSVVLSSHLGVLTVKDLERLLENGSVDINGVTVTDSQLEQIAEDVRKSGNVDMLSLPQQIVEVVTAVQEHYNQQLGSDFQPDLSSLLRPLQKISTLLLPSKQAGSHGVDPSSEGELEQGSQGRGETTQTSVKGVGGIHSRKDAVRQLELVCRYLEINEPANPAPFLVRRAMKLMEMNFMDILKEMAPDGLNQATFITGVDASPDV